MACGSATRRCVARMHVRSDHRGGMRGHAGRGEGGDQWGRGVKWGAKNGPARFNPPPRVRVRVRVAEE